MRVEDVCDVYDDYITSMTSLVITRTEIATRETLTSWNDDDRTSDDYERSSNRMAIKFMLLVSRQGKIRLTKWFTADWTAKEKAKTVKETTGTVLSRKSKMCNVLEYKGFKVVYRRYASLYFIAGTDPDDNELLVLEVIHRYVELLDKWFLNVCELDIIFNFQQAYAILDELLIGGELQESSKRAVTSVLKKIEELEKQEQLA